MICGKEELWIIIFAEEMSGDGEWMAARTTATATSKQLYVLSYPSSFPQ